MAGSQQNADSTADASAHASPAAWLPRGTIAFNWYQRVLLLVSTGGVLALLVVAASLRPSATGLGTHQQLGLPACTSVVLWNVRCPSCGMTTSWALTLRGRIFDALSANVGGTLLAIIALAYVPISCYFSVIGRSSKGGWLSSALAVGLLGSLACAITQWMFWLI